MFNYECEKCNKLFCTTDKQIHPVCNHCKEVYNISDDYVYGSETCTEKESSADETTSMPKQHPLPSSSEPDLNSQVSSNESIVISEDAYLDLLTDMNAKLETLIKLQEQNQKHNATADEVTTDDIVRALWNIAANVTTLKKITVFMFVLFIVCNIIVATSFSH